MQNTKDVLDKDLEEYEHFLSQNHLFEHNLGDASFNPGMLVLFQKKINNKLLDDLVFHHEFEHTLLNASLYGKIIFFFKFVSIDIICFCIENKKDFGTYWKIYLKLHSIILKLVQNWSVIHEGIATYHDYNTLEKQQTEEHKKNFEHLKRFLTKDTPYKEGVNKVLKLREVYTFQSIKNLLHQIGEINYLSHLKKIINDSFELYPDVILNNLLESFFNYKKNRFLIIDGRSVFIPPFWREVINACNKEIEFYRPEIDEIGSFNLMVKQLIEEIDLEDYATRLQNISIEFEQFQINDKNAAPQTKLAFMAEKISHLGYSDINITSKEKDSHIEELIRIYRLNSLIVRHLPDSVAVFQKMAIELNLFKSNNTLSFLDLIFPITSMVKLDNLKKKPYTEKFPLRKDNIEFRFSQKSIKMKSIHIHCSIEDAKELELELQKLNQSKAISFDSKEEELNHWLESIETIVTIVSSSITIIDAVKDWLEKKKAQKETSPITEDKPITVEDDEDKLELIQDYDKILKMLEQRKQESEKKDGRR